MIFQKQPPKYAPDPAAAGNSYPERSDDVETVVGPSVNVEGDFASEGNIIVKGSVTGSVATTKFLLVEHGAKISANVRAGSAKIAGEVRGNMKIGSSLELMSTARIMGDIEAKSLAVEAGALIYGKISMPGLEGAETRAGRAVRPAALKKNEESTVSSSKLLAVS